MDKEINTGLIMDQVANLQNTNTETNTDKSKEQSVFDTQKVMQYFAEYKKMHTPKVREYTIARNDPCPCGSGKKYKKCCMDKGIYEKYILDKK